MKTKNALLLGRLTHSVNHEFATTFVSIWMKLNVILLHFPNDMMDYYDFTFTFRDLFAL